MKRRIIVLFLIVFLISSLFSCRIGEKPDGDSSDNGSQDNSSDSGSSDDGNTDTDENRLYIVLPNGISDTVFFGFASRIGESFNVKTVVTRYSADKVYGSNTIFVGDISTALSDKAYKRLSRIDIDDKEDKRYVIYGSSYGISVAYEDDGYGVNGALNVAFDEIISSYISSDGSISLKNGVLSEGIVNTVAYQREKDEKIRDKMFSDLYDSIMSKTGDNYSLSKAIYDEICNVYALYTDDMISWMANLYCPDTGGFYYSNSARDNTGFLPDIESTAQMLDIIVSSGLSDYDELPSWLRNDMISFVKGLQDPNGYFYHPQWGKEATDKNVSRRSRDLSKAVNFLKKLGAKPTYDTPSGEKGDGILADGTPASAVALTSKLSRSTASAVSAVVLAASFDYSSKYIESVATFTEWLNTVDINSSSYQSYYMGDKLATVINEIIARDAVLKKQGKGGLVDTLAAWLNSKQNEKTGLWTLHSYADIDGVNGLFKILSVYNAMKAELPHSVEALQSTMTILNTVQPEEVVRVCDIFNIWNTLAMIKDNVNAYSSSASVKSEVEEFYGNLLENSVPGLKNTVKCLAVFLKPDGSMSYAPQQSAPTSHGMNVAVPYSYEGDVNGVALGTVGTICDLMPILGLEYIPIYTRGDGIYFFSLLEDMGTIVKHDSPAGEAQTFDDFEIGEECPIITSSSISSSGGVSIVESPGRNGNSLLFKTVNDGYDYIHLPSDSSALSAKCFVFEADFLVDTPDIGAVTQLNPYNDVYMLNIGVTDSDGNGIVDSNDAVTLYETSTNNKSNWILNNFGTVAKVGEWFKLRIEYYPADHDNVRIKIFVNDKLIAVTDTYYGKISGQVNVPKTYFTTLRVIMPSTKNCDLYIDNLIVTKTEDEYVAEKIPEGDPAFDGIMINVDSPRRPEMIYDFENEDDISNLIITDDSGKSAVENGKLVLAGGAKLGLPVNMRSADANCSVFEADVLVSPSSVAGATYELLMRDPLGNAILRLYLKVASENGEKKLVLAEASTGKIGNYLSDFNAPLGEEFRLGIHYYKSEGVVLVYVNGKIVGSTDYLCSGAANYRCTNLDFSDISASGTASSITIDNVISERRVSSYESATAPEFAEQIYDFEKGMPKDFVNSGKISILGGELTLSKANNGDCVIIPLNRRSVNGNSVIFITDIKALTVNNGGFKLELLDADGNVILAYEIIGNGAVYSIYELTAGKRYDDPLASFEPGKYKLGIEFYPQKDICEIFLDDSCIARSSLTYMQNPADLVSVGARLSAVNTSGISFDNIRAEIYDKLYLASNDKFVNSESSSEEYTFESSSTGSLPSPIYTAFYSSKASLGIKENDVYGSVSKVLRYVTSEGGNDSLYIPVTKKLEGASGVAFEADMKLNMLSSSDGIEVYLQVGSSHATKITLKYSGGKIAIYDNAGTV